MYEFKVDFTKSVPFRHCPNSQEAAALYIQCVANAPMDIEFRQVKTGIFNITVSSEADKKRLENKFITYDFGDRTHELHSAKVPLLLQKTRQFFENPKWVTIDKLYDSALRYATNEEIDDFLKMYGDIIVPTHDNDKFGFRTGKRKARIDIKKDLERWQEVEIKTMIDGKEIMAKGRVNFYYRGQPYFCKNCQEPHHEKCPQQIVKQALEKQGESIRLQKTQSLLIGDSNLRRVNENAFYAKTDCATGAKIGHIANTLDFVKKEESKIVICHVGQNNITHDDEVSMEDWSQQTQNEVKSLKEKLSKFETAVIVGVPPAPWCKKNKRTGEMRKKINNAFKALAHDNMNIKYVDIEQEDEDDEGNWEDERHMTEKFTGYVLGKIAGKMQEITGDPFYIKNIPWTAERKYSKVRPTYRYGCEVCTQIGCHDNCTNETTIVNPSTSTSTGKTAKKRGNCSGSDESEPKKR